MIPTIGIFFCALLIILMIYLFMSGRPGKRGRFDVKGATLDREALIWHAGQLARYHELSTGHGDMRFLLNRMTENYRYISAVYRRLTELAGKGLRFTGADEWILDNFYIIEEQTKGLLQNIQKKDFRKLPLIKDGQYTGYPRIFAIALEFVSHTDSVISEGTLVEFICEYQKTAHLADAEIWALSSMLKIALIENIRYLCEHIDKTHNQYEQARQAIAQMKDKGASPEEALGPLFKTPLVENTSLLEHLLVLLKQEGKSASAALAFVDRRLSKMSTSSNKMIAIEHARQAARQVSMGNAITSLRFVLALDYTKIFETLSEVERILNEDGAGIYGQMDQATKNRYRKNVERIAKRFEISEIEVALSAVELSKESGEHIGAYLIDTDLGADNKGPVRLRQGLYQLGVFAVTLGISGFLAWHSGLLAQRPFLTLFLFVLCLFPASDIALHLCNYLTAQLTQATVIPRLDFHGGIPAGYTTFVVISTLLPNPEQARRLAKQLEIYYLGNRQENLYFGLLSDFADNENETMPQDGEILSAAEDVINSLNEKYGPRFYLFHRRRTFNAPNNRYMGYERKRGAIVEFTRLLRGRKDTTFSHIIGQTEVFPAVRYVITLDADTKLPRDSAKELVGAMAHPLNAPRAQGGRVVSGYAIMQPRINIEIESANTSFFSRVFAGQGGIDVYSGAVSDVYQDLFHEGIFTGKGIFDVDMFCELLSETIPENRVLSHDLLEGSYLRCALISDVELIDGFPWKYSSYAARMHRWIRGDWQLLPWLTGQVKNPLTAVSKWKIFDNMRRSLVPVSLAVILLLAFNTLPKDSGVWTGFALLTICFSLLVGAVDWAFHAGYRYLGQRCNAPIIYGLRGIIYEAALLFVLIPHYAYLTLDAALRTLYRMLVSKKKLLEWVTAADAEKKLDNSLKSYYVRMLPSCAYAAALVLLARKGLPLAFFLGVVWVLAPGVLYLASRSAVEKSRSISEKDREFLLEAARGTWQYFVDFTTASDNYLAPDNFQEDPPNKAAHRTSPTNIGLQLLAPVCAVELGFIGWGEALDMLERIAGTIQRLDKWNGHLYNWYNTKTLEVLRPKYISTVDSGNLCGYYVAVMGAMSRLAREEGEHAARAAALEQAFRRLYEQTSFRPLYDEQRHLFTIGYNAEEEHLTRSYYDLLSSEARMASFLAVAKGEVPKKHWFALGRTLVSRDGFRGMVSWTGTMFEYLMPLILMKNFKNTLLDETYHFVIRCQKKYGRLRNVPWGTSESGFNAFDIDLNYQYKAFGVPDLGLKRGLISDMVVAPYASVMALMVEFDEAMDNIRHLKDMGIMGKYGLYEAIDYTPERVLPGTKYSVVKSYMVHHLGMSLLSITNVLADNVLQKLFHSDVTVQAAEELLCERVPTNVVVSKENKEKIRPLKPIAADGAMCVREIGDIRVNHPNAHILSNGKLSSLITDSGCGYISRGELALTRFRNDLQDGIYGNFVYIRDITRGGIWSNAPAPLFDGNGAYRAIFAPHKAELQASFSGVDVTTEIVISPEENAEIRRLTIANHTDGELLLELTNYQETILASLGADSAHPAFSNLFIRTEYDEGTDSVICARRPRDDSASPVFAMQTVLVEGDKVGRTEYETDRARFIGRRRSVRHPAAVFDGMEMAGTVGSVLDPIFSQRVQVRLERGSVAVCSFITALCAAREEAIEISQKFKSPANVERAFDMAWSRARVENKYLGIHAETERLAYEILPHLIYILPRRRAMASEIMENRLGQQSLWALGISGDRPIVALRVRRVEELDVLERLLQMHELWKIKGLSVDLVIISEDEASYNSPLLHAMRDIVSVSHIREMIGSGGGVFLIDSSVSDPQMLTLLLSAARLVLHSDADLAEQLRPLDEENKIPYISFTKREYPPMELSMPQTEYFNGIGGFSGGEYVMRLSDSAPTPLPWSNVIANPLFGTLVTESGGGYSWYHNSRENKITPWSNDPVCDPPSEMIYLRDNQSGAAWTLFTGEYIARHGKGYSVFENARNDVESRLTVFVPRERLLKVNLLELRNHGEEPRSLALTYYLNPILGVGQSETKPFLVIGKDGEFLTASNSYNTDYPGELLYAAASEELASFTCDKREFFGEKRLSRTPNALFRERLSGALGAGYDSCIAMQVMVTLAPGERRSVVFSHGMEKERILPNGAYELLHEAKEAWRERTEHIVVDTPDRSMNILVNHWLLYQTLSSRIFGRAAFYQCGGAYGFRDQIQDSLALLLHDPAVAREQILRCAARQYKEGDVQHWWHELLDGFRGIRTRFSDDLLWLPYAVSEYVRVTGDASILHEQVPYIEGEALAEGEDEKYAPAAVSELSETVEQHCMRAIARARRFGERGLPLMGSGDWNDGMSHVGNRGKGESVWLGWFLYDVLRRFGIEDEALRENLNKAWDGAWYHRAYTDEGQTLGSSQNTECKIDAIAQAWSVISGAGDEEYQKSAMDSLMKYLVSREEGMVKLLTPPFDNGEIHPGYIRGYVPGVRENGGQYTHAAAWVVLAFAQLGMGDVAGELFAMINPINHARTPIEVSKYKTEPYSVAADVYSTGANLGRGGWTWYTGAAGWLYRTAVEWILGVRREGTTLIVDPCIPRHWKSYSVSYRYGRTTYQIHVKNPSEKTKAKQPVTAALVDDGVTHTVEVVLG